MQKATSISKTSRTAKRGRPALTPEARENQLISLSYNVAEEQLRNGTASSQVITHFLKLGSVKAQLELEKIKRENTLLEAKAEAIESTKRIEAIYLEAISALKSYAGHVDSSYEYDMDGDRDDEY